jgi:hypothetical protein
MLRKMMHGSTIFLANIAEHREREVAKIALRAQHVIARCEAIRYVQLGNPDTILIDEGETQKRVEEAAKAHQEAQPA